MLIVADTKKEMGDRLRLARERKNLRQNKVSSKLGVHNSTVAKYESGEREPDAETIKKLADMYEVTVSWILGHEETMSEQSKNEVIEAYNRLTPDKKRIIDDMIKALIDNR